MVIEYFSLGQEKAVIACAVNYHSSDISVGLSALRQKIEIADNPVSNAVFRRVYIDNLSVLIHLLLDQEFLFTRCEDPQVAVLLCYLMENVFGERTILLFGIMIVFFLELYITHAERLIKIGTNLI